MSRSSAMWQCLSCSLQETVMAHWHLLNSHLSLHSPHSLLSFLNAFFTIWLTTKAAFHSWRVSWTWKTTATSFLLGTTETPLGQSSTSSNYSTHTVLVISLLKTSKFLPKKLLVHAPNSTLHHSCSRPFIEALAVTDPEGVYDGMAQDIVSEILDMISPADRSQITAMDIIHCRNGYEVFGMLTDATELHRHEHRDDWLNCKLVHSNRHTHCSSCTTIALTVPHAPAAVQMVSIVDQCITKKVSHTLHYFPFTVSIKTVCFSTSASLSNIFLDQVMHRSQCIIQIDWNLGNADLLEARNVLTNSHSFSRLICTSDFRFLNSNGCPVTCSSPFCALIWLLHTAVRRITSICARIHLFLQSCVHESLCIALCSEIWFVQSNEHWNRSFLKEGIIQDLAHFPKIKAESAIKCTDACMFWLRCVL